MGAENEAHRRSGDGNEGSGEELQGLGRPTLESQVAKQEKLLRAAAVGSRLVLGIVCKDGSSPDLRYKWHDARSEVARHDVYTATRARCTTLLALTARASTPVP